MAKTVFLAKIQSRSTGMAFTSSDVALLKRYKGPPYLFFGGQNRGGVRHSMPLWRMPLGRSTISRACPAFAGWGGVANYTLGRAREG
jgi:hypothetical protein